MKMNGVRPGAYDEAARTDYLTVVASLANADGHIDSSEVAAIRDLALHFGLQPAARARVLASCECPPEDLGPILARLSRSDLRYSLLTDLCTLAYVDGALVSAEVQQVRQFAERLHVPAEQADALLRFAGRVDRGRRSFEGLRPDAVAEAREELARAGVPLAPVAISGAMRRLAEAGVELGAGWD